MSKYLCPECSHEWEDDSDKVEEWCPMNDKVHHDFGKGYALKEGYCERNG